MKTLTSNEINDINNTPQRRLERVHTANELLKRIVSKLTINNYPEQDSPEFYRAAENVLEDGAFLKKWFKSTDYDDAEELAIINDVRERAQRHARYAAMTDIELAREHDAYWTDHTKNGTIDALACMEIHRHRMRTRTYNEMYSSGKYKIQTPSERSTLKRQRDKRALDKREYGQMTDRGLGDALAKQYVTLIQSDDDEKRGVAAELKTGIETELTRRIRNAGVERHYRPRTMPA